MSQQPQPQPQAPAKRPPPVAPFDIDNYLNPWIPQNPIRLLPPSISFYLGHRVPHQKPPVSIPLPAWYFRYHINVIALYVSIFIGSFCGITIIENVFLALPRLGGHEVPIVIASFGAAAILEYNTVESPLAQPRNLVFGHFFSATVAVSITKLFEHLSPERFEELRWLVGALCVAVASVTMGLTKTVHPPAGATALLAATNVDIQALGWWLLPLVLLSASLMLASAMVCNNTLGRRFPVYWWTPVDLKKLREQRRQTAAAYLEKADDLERGSETSGTASVGEAETEHPVALSHVATETGSMSSDLRKRVTRDMDLNRWVSYSSADRVPRHVTSEEETKDVEGEEDKIVVSEHEMILPDWLELSDWEDKVLRILMERIKEH